MPDETTTIEINGVKMEVDLRHAKRVDTYRIGDRVRVLVKEYSSYRVYPGVIVAFDAFQKLPSIQIAYIKKDHSSTKLEIVTYHKGAENIEISADYDDGIEIDKGDVLSTFATEIQKKQAEIDDIRRKQEYFLAKFGQYFGEFSK